MPRLGSETSSIRRHNHPQTSPDHPQLNPPLRQPQAGSSPRNLSPPRQESFLSHCPGRLDAPDDLLSRNRASGSRNRWNARMSARPYGHGQRSLHKRSSSELKRLEEMGLLVDLLPEPGEEKDGKPEMEMGAEDPAADKQPEMEEAARDTLQDRSTSKQSQAEVGFQAATPPHGQPLSVAAVRKLEENESKPTKRKLAADKTSEHTPVLNIASHPPKDFLASMSRITKLVQSINSDISQIQSDEILQTPYGTHTEDSQSPASNSAQWQTEVLQRVKRMENMLGQMEKWHTQVAPGEIQALKQETTRLEVRVRAMAEHKEQRRSTGKSKAGAQVQVSEAKASSLGEEQVGSGGGRPLQTGAREQGAEDEGSSSDSVPESDSCLSESETGPTEPDPEDHSSLIDNKTDSSQPPAVSPPSRPVPSVSESPPSLQLPTRYPQVSPGHFCEPSKRSVSGAASPALSTLAPKNYNLPPEPPQDPVEYLGNHPWTMLEVLFLLEVVAHFPPAEHGWTFIAEAYNNILITRPLQEWFGKQASASHEEEAKMRTVLRNMSAEARQLRSRADHAVPSPTATGTGTAGANTTAGQRGKAAPFGSTEARAEANARLKTSATQPTPTAPGIAAKDALIVTRLPFPIEVRPAGKETSSLPTPPPAQHIVPFPRRRPPLTLPSADAHAFARVMKSAAAGVRPPSAESRAAMLALYSATKSRFPVRTSWDCWHRWCTPWIVQDQLEEIEDKPSIVLDYVSGNLAVPCGTWISQSQGFEYRPVPGTYPNAPGVQHRVSTGYDPRSGMVSFARMAHLIAEKAWSDIGLGRVSDGRVTDEVLTRRRAKLPATLAGLWPGKAQPPVKPGANPHPAASPPVPASTAAPAVHSGGKQPVTPAQNSARVPPRTSNASVTAPPGGPKAPVIGPTNPPNGTASRRSSPPFRPLPEPRRPPPRDPPRVPEGTLGNTVRPGIRAWFDHAATRSIVVERLVAGGRSRETSEKAFGAVESEDDSARGGISASNARIRAWEEQREREREEFGRWMPLHLRNVVVPPPPPRLWLSSRKQSGESAEVIE